MNDILGPPDEGGRAVEKDPVDRTAILVEVAVELESLRQSNPINGDGSNYTLTQALNRVSALAGDERMTVVEAVRAVRDQRAADDLARYQRLLADYRREETDRG